MMPTRRQFLKSTIAGSAMMLAGFGSRPGLANRGVQVLEGSAFGGSWRLVHDGKVKGSDLSRAIFTIVDDVNLGMSPWLKSSRLSRFNLSQSSEWFEAGIELQTVVDESLRVSKLTAGAFDPTVGPLVRKFGFGPISGGEGLVDDIDSHQGLLKKRSPLVTLDLCGIAKGHALDRMLDAIHRLGCQNALLELGGEIAAIGRHPKGRPWLAAVSDPRVGYRTAFRIIEIDRRALATSGHAHNGIMQPIRASHIINPSSGEPASGDLLSVSVLEDAAMTADALATGMMVMGTETAAAFAEEQGIAALLIYQDGQLLREITTANMKQSIRG